MHRQNATTTFSPDEDEDRLARVRRSLVMVTASVVAAAFGSFGGEGRALADAEPPPPAASTIVPDAPLEAPPPPPRHKGVVLESRLGALAFLGDFKHVAPTAPWWHVDVGYEILKQLAVFGYGELAFTSTSETETAANATAFPIYGFGGGVRVTIHATDRVAFFLEGDLGTLRADVPRGTLANLGYGNAETFSFAAGGRLGVEWYQVDRHLAFGLDVGVRDALGFAEQFIGTGPPLMLDASGAIRYTF
jgi:hypothetical protein